MRQSCDKRTDIKKIDDSVIIHVSLKLIVSRTENVYKWTDVKKIDISVSVHIPFVVERPHRINAKSFKVSLVRECVCQLSDPRDRKGAPVRIGARGTTVGDIVAVVVLENCPRITNGDLAGSQPIEDICTCLLYTSPSPRDQRGSRMPSSA